MGIRPKTAFQYRLRLDELADLTEAGSYTVSVSITLLDPFKLNPPDLAGKTLGSNKASFEMTEPDPINLEFIPLLDATASSQATKPTQP
jgi:hypothetical protein